MTRPRTGRRELLAAIGSAGLIGIAGCTGGDGGETPTDSPTPTPTPTPTTPNQSAVEHYETAIEALIEIKATLDEWAESGSESDEIGRLQDRVATANEALTAAEADADPSGEFIGRIEQAKLVADFQELSLAYYEAGTVFFELIAEAGELGGNELHQRAADTFAEAKGVLDDARQVIEDMGTVLEEIENETLDEPALEYTGEPLDHLDLADTRAIDGAESYATGYEHIHLAFVQLGAGQEHYENEAFGEAREAWETGRQRAVDSRSAFEAAIDNDFTPQDLQSDSIERLADVETIVDAFEKFVAGATEAEAGNHEKGNTLVREGFDLLGEL